MQELIDERTNAMILPCKCPDLFFQARSWLATRLRAFNIDQVCARALCRRAQILRTFFLRAFFLCSLLQSCSSSNLAMDTSPVAGWRFQITVKFPSQQRYELFRITPTGEIQYGGGMSAMNDYTTWETALTPEQAKEFIDLMNSLSWIQNVPKETGDDKTEPVIVVKYQQRGGTERYFAIRGNTPESDKVIAIMKGFTQQRFQAILKKLPEATEKPRTPAPTTAPPTSATPAPTTAPPTSATPAPTSATPAPTTAPPTSATPRP